MKEILVLGQKIHRPRRIIVGTKEGIQFRILLKTPGDVGQGIGMQFAVGIDEVEIGPPGHLRP